MLGFDVFDKGLSYEDFLDQYATAAHRQRWDQVHQAVELTDAQRELLRSFTREMNVLCLAGAWCGDCSGQCPIFEHFASVNPLIRVRYLDRDDHADVQRELQINGGNRVPVLVFFSEDGYEVSRFGERTLSKYRQMILDLAPESCPTGLMTGEDSLLSRMTQDWLNEFERVQWILRLSPRLRQRHGD